MGRRAPCDRYPAVTGCGSDGEAVKAWVVLRAGQQVTADELRAAERAQLAAYKVPKAIEFRAALPKNMIGKVLRRELVSERADTGVTA